MLSLLVMMVSATAAAASITTEHLVEEAAELGMGVAREGEEADGEEFERAHIDDGSNACLRQTRVMRTKIQRVGTSHECCE